MDLASRFSSGEQFHLMKFKIQEHRNHTTVAVRTFKRWQKYSMCVKDVKKML